MSWEKLKEMEKLVGHPEEVWINTIDNREVAKVWSKVVVRLDVFG